MKKMNKQMTKEEKIEAEKKDYEVRVLAYRLYHGYEGDNTISEDELINKMFEEGWFDLPKERIRALLRSKGLLKNE
jgi:hypothetical protein